MKYAAVIYFLLATYLITTACSRAVVGTPDVQVVTAEAVSLDPEASVWNNAPMHVSKLILQDLVEPRQMEISTAEVRSQAITDGRELTVRLEWNDETVNDKAMAHNFVDSCAIQFAAAPDTNIPAPQMGEIGKTVQISFWRADWQAIVDGRADTITTLYPNAKPDHYPFEAESLKKDPKGQAETAMRYAPARALGNNRQGPREHPVEDLIAEGPGTLSPSPNNFSKGKGIRTSTGWAVVLSRPLPEGFSAERPSQIAFAIWEGTHGDTGARKMRTGWVSMVMK